MPKKIALRMELEEKLARERELTIETEDKMKGSCIIS